jgi:hypothetical protein
VNIIDYSDLPAGTIPSEPGMYRRVPFHVYLQIVAANFSSLKHLDVSPRCYKWHKDHPGGDKDTPAKKFGRAVHSFVLEPDVTLLDYTVYRESKSKGEGAVKRWKAFQAANQDKEILDVKDYDRALLVRETIREHDAVSQVLDACDEFELTIIWEHRSGRIMKSRIDGLGQPIIADLKSCRDPRPHRFESDAERYLYRVQAAFYQDAVGYATSERPKPYSILAAETGPPYDAAEYLVPTEMLLDGRCVYEKWLEELGHCEREGMWPGFAEETLILGRPGWATKDDDKDPTGLGLDWEGKTDG